VSLERIGTLHEAAGRWQEAEAAYRESFSIRQALATSEPGHRNIQRDLAIAYEKLGKVERAAGGAGATAGIDNLRGALAQFDRLAAVDPADVNAARSAAISREVLATALRESRQLGEARQLFETALATHDALAARDAGNAQARCDTVRLHEFIGDTLQAASAPRSQACAHWRQSATTLDALNATGTTCSTGGTGASGLADKLRACS